VWLVEIKLPMELLKKYREGYLEIEGKDIDLSEIDKAYEEGLDQTELKNVKKVDNNETAN
jgi:hypothetical protein